MTAPAGVPPRAGTLTLIGRGATLACGACGGRGLFGKGFVIRERCPTCGLRMERTPGMWLGSIGINTIVTFAALFVALVVSIVATWPDIPVVPLTLVAVGVAITVPIVFFPFSRTLWLAVDLAMRPPKPEEFEAGPDPAPEG